VLQDLFTRLATRPSLLESARDVRAYLIRLAHNLAVDIIRRRAARDRATEALATESVGLFAPTDDPDAASFRREIEAALGDLPPDQRAVVHLKLWSGLTFEGISESLGIPLNTAASRYRYGLDKLRSRLRPFYEEIR
jgi:RNA polymerase sigma-70 factor (ECF subfamily)